MGRLLHIPAALLLTVCGTVDASAAVIGVVAPQSGTFAVLGKQITDGAKVAATLAGNSIIVIDEPCDTNARPQIAEKLAAAKAEIAIGFLCGETITVAMPGMKDKGIPGITVSVRSEIAMEDAARDGWPLFRLAPSDRQEADAITNVILDRWADEAIALVDDGTIRSRELTAAVRAALEKNGLDPIFTDTYRPGEEKQVALVRRLKKVGATHVFVAGDRSDIAIIANDAKSDNIAMTFFGGDALRAADGQVSLPDGVMGVVLPLYSNLPEASKAAAALRDNGSEPEGYALPAYAAAEIASVALSDAAGSKRPIADVLVGTTFSTAIGKIGFAEDHNLAENPFRLQVWKDGAFRDLTP
ncbi:ABC transporter substrate-binding protein [Rhizobium sp. PAMB 3174]